MRHHSYIRLSFPVCAIVLSSAVSTSAATMTTALNQGRASKEEVFKVMDFLYHWALGKGKGPAVAQKIVNCLDEQFLLSLPPPHRNHTWPTHTGTRNWRYLFRRQVGVLLGWSQQLPEGHPDGIPDEVNAFLREQQWPTRFDRHEGSCEARGGNEIEGTSSRECPPPTRAPTNRAPISAGVAQGRIKKRRPAPHRRAPIRPVALRVSTGTISKSEQPDFAALPECGSNPADL